MIATLSTVDGPQLTMDAVEAVKLLMKLPLCDYAISFQPGGNVMNTPDTDRPTDFPKPEVLAPPKSFDDLRRQTGSGGFISIGSICGKVVRRTARKRLYRHTLHAGR